MISLGEIAPTHNPKVVGSNPTPATNNPLNFNGFFHFWAWKSNKVKSLLLPAHPSHSDIGTQRRNT